MSIHDKDDQHPTGNISESEEQSLVSQDDFRTETDTQQDFEEADLEFEEDEKSSKGKMAKLIAGGSVLAVILAGGAVFALSGGDDKKEESASQPEIQQDKANVQTEVKQEAPQVVKTSEGINAQTSDPELSAAMNVQKPTEVKTESPFKDVPEAPQKLAEPMPVQNIEAPTLTQPHDVKNELTQPVVGSIQAPTLQADVSVHTPSNIGIETPSVVQPLEQLNANTLQQPSPSTGLTPPVAEKEKEPVVQEKSVQNVPKVESVATIPVAPEAGLINPQAPQAHDGQLLGGGSQGGMIDPTDLTSEANKDDDEINGSMKEILDQMNKLSTNIKSLDEKVSKIDPTILVKQSDFDKLVARVAELEKFHTNKEGVMVACPCEPAKKTPAKKTTTVKKQYKPKDSISVVKKAGDLATTKTHYKPKKQASKAGVSMKLESVVGDRAWIRVNNGSIRSYSIGDTLPNGKVIGNVDSRNGVFDKSGVKVLSR